MGNYPSDYCRLGPIHLAIMDSSVAFFGIGLERTHRFGQTLPDLFGNAWPEQKSKRAREPYAVNDFRSAICGNNRVLKM